MRSGPTIVAVAVAAAAGLALAQSGPARPILHQDLPAPTGDVPAPSIGSAGKGNPTAFAAGDKVLPQPAHDQPAAKGEPVLGTTNFASDRQTSMRPDENTGPDSTLHYVSVFNPDVLPFKRMSAFDAVADDYTLRVARTALTEVPVGGTPDARTRDRFWGDVLVALVPGVDVALPSVAPDMRILSYEVTPAIRLKFAKDGADNFYVRSDEPNAAGTYRLVFFADADAGYFAPSLPPHRYTPRTLGVPPELRPIVPPQVLRAARITLDKLAVDADMELGVAFNRLVGYFRAFTAKPIPNATGDTYRDLCDSQAGVCRHRSFAFMVTANALGIPTRLVENEAHAFVEVWFPERNWQRIDLGGAALRMDVTGADNKTLHRPRADDPFAKPPEYTKQYTALEGEIHGLSGQQIADKRRSLDQAPASGSLGSGGNAFGPDRITPDPTLPVVTRDPKKATPHLRVTLADESAYRGSTLRVAGIVQVDGRGLADHGVDIFLARAGENGQRPIPIGHAVSGPDGTFGVDLTVPAELGLVTYELFLSSNEDAYYNAALSN